jgi:beta-lactam-binding protein with PASTA domain
MMKNRLKILGDRASDSDADILRDEFADFGKDAQIPDDARERILSSVMGKAGFKMNGTNGVIKGHKNITANKTDNNITEHNGKLRIHRGGAIAACIALLAAGAVTTGLFFKNNNIKYSGRTSNDIISSDEESKTSELTMPNYVGMNIDYIYDVDENIHDVFVVHEYNPDYDEGIVFWQNIEPGEVIDQNDNIILKVSDSISDKDGVITIPNFLGKNIEQVKQDWGEKIKIDSVFEYNLEYEEGMIFWQSQNPGNSVKEGYTITLKVSKGKQKTVIPDVSGSESEVAESELRAAQFTVVLRSKYDDNVPEGIAIGTEPAAGTEFALEGAVTLYVSKGPLDTQVKVPNVVGLNKESAIKLLKENDLKPVVVDLPYDGDKGQVIDQSINPGWKIDKDTEVNIYVSTGVSDPVDLTISIPMPDGLSGEFTLDGYVNGNRRYTQTISDGKAVSGGAVTMDITGKNKETITVMIKNEDTGKSVTYAVFDVDYGKKTAELKGSLNKDELLATMK